MALIALLAALTAWVVAMVPAQRRVALHTRGDLHPFVHLALFGFIAWLSAWTTRSPKKRVWFCLGVALLGCATEYTEHALYGNVLEWTDIVLDAMGAVAGTGLGALTLPRSRRRNS